jgi:hypothetical protein
MGTKDMYEVLHSNFNINSVFLVHRRPYNRELTFLDVEVAYIIQM